VRTGIILTTYGEPSRNTFGAQWIYSYRILERLTRKIARIPAPLLPLIATARARTRVSLWREHGFTSPLEPLHEETVAALERELRRRGRADDVVVARAYEFRRPNLTDAIGALGRAGCERVLIVPMYIAGGDFTDGMTRLAVEDALARLPAWRADRLAFCTLSSTAPAIEQLASTLAAHCLQAMHAAGIVPPARDWAILLAAHGTVIAPPPGVDNGLVQYGRVLLRLKSLLKPHAGLVRIGWLNHTRGGKWSTPPVGEALEHVRRRGFDKLVYFPWGFTTDNAETALEGRIALAALSPPLRRVEYLTCMNSERAFVSLLAERVLEAMNQVAPAGAGTGPAHRAIPA
jgi:protoporphyrin/coproporphyrin ferrochelatase